MHFFVFQLRPAEGSKPVPDDPPVAVFAMHPLESAPVSAIVVTPSGVGEEAEIMNLREPESVYTAPFVV